MQNRRLSVETLEDRRLLAIFIAGEHYPLPPLGDEVGYVAPPQSGFAPIALPDGIVPPGATELPPPPSGELPPGLPNLSGVAETNAVALAVGWMYTHEDAVGDVVGQAVPDNYSLALEVHAGLDFFRYGVSESASEIAARYVVRDGVHSEILSSFELAGPLDGGLVYAQFDNNLLTAMAVHSQTGGVATLWTYPESPGSGADDPGLSFPAGYAALDALVAAHLDGPAAAAALDTFHFAVDEYFELAGVGPVLADFNHDQHVDAADYVVWRKNDGSAADFSLWRSHFGESVPASGAAMAGAAAPEPGTIALAALAAGGAALVSQRRREREDEDAGCRGRE